MPNNDKRENIEIAIVVITTIIAIILMVMFAPKQGSVKVIDCTWVEISPDFTEQMRKECRQARSENFQKDLQKPK